MFCFSSMCTHTRTRSRFIGDTWMRIQAVEEEKTRCLNRPPKSTSYFNRDQQSPVDQPSTTKTVYSLSMPESDQRGSGTARRICTWRKELQLGIQRCQNPDSDSQAGRQAASYIEHWTRRCHIADPRLQSQSQPRIGTIP